MAKVRFDEHGNMINSETGEVVGRSSNGHITIDSVAAPEIHYDVSMPEPPPSPEDIDENGNSNDVITIDQNESSSSENESIPASEPVGESEHVNQKNEESSNSSKSSESYTPKYTKRKNKSKYEVTEDSTFTIRFGLKEVEKGHFVPIKIEATEKIPESERHWVTFRMWTYDEELKWKQECLEYNQRTKIQSINLNALNEKKIRRLMLDWSFSEYDSSLKLLHCDGLLSDESYLIFKGMYPSIACTIVDLMNMILDNNQ